MRARLRGAPASLLVCLALVLALPAAAGAAPNVWVNEIHYDNAGPDVGEGVEVAGPAGTDLAGWRIEFSSGFDSRTYATRALSGALPDQGNGFGTSWLPVSGIQNGPRDGIALVDGANGIVQFLGYEGSLTPIDGTAAGLTSVSILPFEHPSTPLGRSLQLTGTGTSAGAFTWNATSGASPGAVNAGQAFPAPPRAPVDDAPPATPEPPAAPEPAAITRLLLRHKISVARALELDLGKIRYVLSGRAKVSFTVAQLMPSPYGSGIGPSGPVVGTIADAGDTGRNTVAFGARLGGRPLRPGHYLLTARIGDEDEAYAAFRVTR
jgi:hypothetical protein